MAKFDSDFAIFGTFAADIAENVKLGDNVINYVNQACIDQYGDLRGQTIQEFFSAICGTAEKCSLMMEKFAAEGMVECEGKLDGKIVKLHSRIIDCRDHEVCPKHKFIQAGLTDITESIILKRLLYGTSEALKRAAKAADEGTGNHVERINRYAELLAKLLGYDGKFLEDISHYAQLHDIGKISVAQLIKLPRKLTAEEFEIVKKHTVYGGEMVEGLDGLDMAYNIALDHHEKWDGSGYPVGKKRAEISLEGRIVALIDIFDALVSPRPYKPAFDYQKTFRILSEGDGRVMPGHFDPEVLEAFIHHYDQFVGIHKQLIG